jgi:DNA-binding response OmpR family regulator
MRARRSPVGNDAFGKPFSYPELRARVAALLRRAELRRGPARLRLGDLEVDSATRVVPLCGAPVELLQKDFAIPERPPG